jgi:hypothetical protein
LKEGVKYGSGRGKSPVKWAKKAGETTDKRQLLAEETV